MFTRNVWQVQETFWCQVSKWFEILDQAPNWCMIVNSINKNCDKCFEILDQAPNFDFGNFQHFENFKIISYT